ncbi:MAG: hypothetical protein LBQ66_02320 [Planctomycetaceae bacterium]|nr:hypothetical protein [Planctomycetaceae bacterium]
MIFVGIQQFGNIIQPVALRRAGIVCPFQGGDILECPLWSQMKTPLYPLSIP